MAVVVAEAHTKPVAGHGLGTGLGGGWHAPLVLSEGTHGAARATMQGGVGLCVSPRRFKKKRTKNTQNRVTGYVTVPGAPFLMQACRPVQVKASPIDLPSAGGAELQGFQIPREPDCYDHNLAQIAIEGSEGVG